MTDNRERAENYIDRWSVAEMYDEDGKRTAVDELRAEFDEVAREAAANTKHFDENIIEEIREQAIREGAEAMFDEWHSEYRIPPSDAYRRGTIDAIVIAAKKALRMALAEEGGAA